MRKRQALEEQVCRTIRHFRMILPGQKVIVACSGGADSTALLLLLHELAGRLGCVLSVAHCNHGLRGPESDQDEGFVRELAEGLGLACHVERLPVREAARKAGANLEATARRMRYGFLLSLLEAGKADRVAVGHTADDQAETVLYRFLRGAGTRGLAGIYPVLEGKVIRPLLPVRRQAVRFWLVQRQQEWREDSSNQDLRQARNRIRHRLLPLLVEFNPRIVATLTGAAEIAREEEAFWGAFLAKIAPELLRVEKGRVVVEIPRLRSVPVAVARRVLRLAVGQATAIEGAGVLVSKPWPGLDFAQVERLLALVEEGQSGSELSLPHDLVARNEFGHLILERAGAADPPRKFCYPVHVPATVEVPEIGRRFTFKLVRSEKELARYNKKGWVLLDAALREGFLFLRNWLPGDTYRPKGCAQQRKLKEFFQRNRIPRGERSSWPVLLAGERVVWVRGLELAEEFCPKTGGEQAILLEEARLGEEGGDPAESHLC